MDLICTCSSCSLPPCSGPSFTFVGKNEHQQEMLSTESALGVRETLESQKFSLPELFPEKADAVKYLEAEQLWAVHPGLWVTSILEPKLAVSGAVCLPVGGVCRR